MATFQDNLLAGKTAFVAGASSGINLQIATRLAQAGAKVTILSRSPDKIEAAAQGIRDPLATNSFQVGLTKNSSTAPLSGWPTGSGAATSPMSGGVTSALSGIISGNWVPFNLKQPRVHQYNVTVERSLGWQTGNLLGPTIGGICMYEKAIKAAFAPNRAVTPHFVDCFLTYHVLQGEIHCGTNSKRKPPKKSWWHHSA